MQSTSFFTWTSSCVERVRTLYVYETSTTEKGELVSVFDSLSAGLRSEKLVSDDDLLELLRRGKLLRYYEIGWCFPYKDYHDYQAIRLVNYYDYNDCFVLNF